jgi:fimbrial chaperone protein
VTRRGLGLWLAAGALFLCSLAARGASLGISPLRVELSAAQTTGALTLRNAGDAPTLVQVRAVAWSQRDGEEIYEATEDVIVSPPIFTLQGNSAQVIRVGLRRAPDAERELSYRLFLQEVPAPPKPGQPGVQMALRIGLPVFVAPTRAQAHKLEWRATREADGALSVVADNPGNLHVQVVGFDLVGAGEAAESLVKASQSAYILPGQRQRWRLTPKVPVAPGAKVTVRAQTDAGDLAGALALDPP